ncbi:MAG: MaoC/PaaZ C-terminal domain-containing protein [Spirochaetota bacterium]
MNRDNIAINEKIAEIEIDKYRPIYYAAASGDFNPLHIDPELAQSFGLKRNILHGLCTIALVVDAVGSKIGNPAAVKKFKCRFVSPVYPGDMINISIKEIEDSIVELEVINQDNNKILDKVSVHISNTVPD